MSANVALSDTFDQWRVKTNELLVMTQVDGSSNFLKLTNSTDSTGNTTGSIITAGGMGVAKSVTIGQNLTVHGNIHANGNISADGSLTLGSDNTDDINFNADISSNVVPNTDSTHNLGNTTYYWANAFINTIDVQQESDAGKPGIKVTGADADARLVEILGSQTTNDILYVNAASLTTGSAFVINQDLSDTTTRTLGKIVQDNIGATGTTGLTIQMDAGRGLFIDTNLATGGYSLEIDAEQAANGTVKIDAATTTNTVMQILAPSLTSGKMIDLTSTGTVTGSIIDITADSATTGTGISMSMDGLTTGKVASFVSDSSSTGTRSLIDIITENSLATGTTGLTVRSDAGRGVFIDTNLATGGYALEIDAEQTTTNTAKIASAATSGTILELQGGGVLTGTVLDITADSATTGKGINISMDGLTTGEAITVASTGTHSGNLVSLVSDGNATGTSLYVRNDSTTATTPVIQFANSSSTVFRVDVSGDINAAGHIGSSNTGALLIPVGNTVVRPSSPSQGQVRFNSDIVVMEIYNGTEWIEVGSGSGGAANTMEVRVEGTITSLGDGVTNTVYVQVEANTTLAGTYGNRMTISGNDSSAANTFVVDTMVMYNGSSTTVNLTDIGSAERLGNDTLGSGAVQVTVGTPANINSTAFEIPVSFKNTDSGNAKTNVPWKIVTKVYGDTALANIYSSYTT